MTKKQTWLVLTGAVLFFIGWWFLGNALEDISTKAMNTIGIVVLILLVIASLYLMTKR